MVDRSERPLTDAEREVLRDRLRQCHEHLADGALKAVLLVLFDGLAIWAILMAVLGEDRSGVAGMVAGAVAIVVANLFLGVGALSLPSDLRERRQLRAAQADGIAVLDTIETHGAALLTSGVEDWWLLAVGSDQLLAVPSQLAEQLGLLPGSTPGVRWPVCCELVLTRAHRLPLTANRVGQASLPVEPVLALDAVVSDANSRRQIAVRLEAGALFSGRLSDLRSALQELVLGSPAAPADATSPCGERCPSGPRWATLQARLESLFNIDFGPDGLVLALNRQAARRPGPLAVRDVVELVLQRLPPGAAHPVRPIRPAFYRLRAALVATCGVARHQVQPATLLEDLVPQQRRLDHWQRLRARLGRPVPPLSEPEASGGVAVAAATVAVLGMLLTYALGIPATQAVDAAAQEHGLSQAWWYYALGICCVPTFFIGGMALSFALPLYLFRHRFHWSFKAAYRTVGYVARYLAETDTTRCSTVLWTPESVQVAVRLVLGKAANHVPLTIQLDTRLVEDLGLPLPSVCCP